MIDPQGINSIIVDFDGTLCSGRYFEPLGQDALDAIAQLVFGDNSPHWADPWMKGELSSHDIAVYLSKHLPNSAEDILSSLREGCSNMPINPVLRDFTLQQREVGRKTALVTANMDVFTEVVVPANGLEAQFDIVLNTADHGTLDKGILWRRAFEFFGPGYSFDSALLIEDSPEMVLLFQSLGGFAYRYEGDQDFLAWLTCTWTTSGWMWRGKSAPRPPGRSKTTSGGRAIGAKSLGRSQ